jgi:hypothetical protein
MIAYWRIQSLSSLLALCGVCSGGFCFALAVGGSGSQSPLGRALCRPYCVFYVFKKLQFIPAVNSPKKTKGKILTAPKILPAGFEPMKEICLNGFLLYLYFIIKIKRI